MKRPYVPALMGVILLAGPAASQGVPARPTGYPPTQAEAGYRDGFILAKIVYTEQIPEKRLGTRTGLDGKTTKFEYTIMVPKLVTREEKIEAKQATVYRAGGQTVAIEQLATVLAKPQTIFFSYGDRKVDPFYLQFLADDVLIIVAPPPAPMVIPLPKPEKTPT